MFRFDANLRDAVDFRYGMNSLSIRLQTLAANRANAKV